MILEAIAGFVGAATLTVVLGAPIASSLAQPKRLFAPPDKDREARKPRTEGIRGFTPLDLGPDPVLWPSQHPWALHSTLKEPQWPSQSWDDEHFGKHWTNHPQAGPDTGFHAMADRSSGADGQPAPEAVKARAKEGEARRRKESKASSEPRPRAATAPPAPVITQVQPRPEPRAEAPRRTGGKGPPDAAEVEHLIATQGLAATVQVIMQRTGWEFREAAQYLAKLRKT